MIIYKKVGILIALFAFLLIFFGLFVSQKNDDVLYISLGEKSFVATQVDTDIERVKGLSGRKELPLNEGLFFVFEGSAMHKFWMKDMNFAIDIIWIRNDLTVADISRNISPDTFPKTFSPKEPVRYVLEVNANEAASINIDDKVTFVKNI